MFTFILNSIQSLLFRKEDSDETQPQLKTPTQRRYSYGWKRGPQYGEYKKHRLMVPQGKKNDISFSKS